MGNTPMIEGGKADGHSTPIPQYSAVRQSAYRHWALPAAENGKCHGIIQERIDTEDQSCSVVTLGETYAIAEDAISVNDLVCAAGTNGKIKSAAASYTTNLSNATNNDLVWTSLVGDGVTLEYFDPGGTSATLTIYVFGKHIRVSLGRTSSAIDTTGDLLKAAIAAHTAAAALVSVEDAAANDGTGLVAALSTVSLTGAENALGRAIEAATADGDIIKIRVGVL